MIKLQSYLLCLVFVLEVSVGSGQALTNQQYREDFDYFWTTISNYYCYSDKKQTDWNKVKQIYAPFVDTVDSRNGFVQLMEKVFYEIYDHHASLNTNTSESQRLVPSGTDIWVEYVNGKPVIIEVRRGFGAERSGLRAGMEIVSYNGIPIESAITAVLPVSLKKPDVEAKNYALRHILAGKHSEIRKIKTRLNGKEQDFYPDQPRNLLVDFKYESSVESRILAGNIGYIRINNRLWDEAIIPVFDSMVNTMMGTKGMIIDLRETPSGGNTTVARAIIGRFISKEGFYQKHELCQEQKETGIKRSWVEVVSPRFPVYTKPVAVLVNHWTGSVSEGITIGFDALKRATIVGTRMAGLIGANYSFTMPHSKIGFSFPSEKLFHVNGTPRENFKPTILVDLNKKDPGTDWILEKAISLLRAGKK